MKTDSLASGNHFLPFSQIAANCCHGSSFFFNWNIFFSQSFIPTSEKELFVDWSIFLFQAFFLLIENITEIWGKSNFKEWTPMFFDFFRYFLKWKPCFCIVEAYFSIFFIRVVQTDFLPTETLFFWSKLFCYYGNSFV